MFLETVSLLTFFRTKCLCLWTLSLDMSFSLDLIYLDIVTVCLFFRLVVCLC